MKKFLFGILGLLFAVPAVAATLPAGYTELEYIESTGTQYIDTGIVPNSNSVYRMTTTLNFQSIPSGEKWFATATGTGAALGRFQFCGVYNKRFVYGYGSDWNYASQTLNTNTDYPIDVTLSNGNQNFNGTSSTYSTQTGSFESSLYLFAFNTGSGVPTYAISVKASVVDIYQDDVLTFNGVPVCRNSDNVVGMYDTVSGTFFTNAGTGEFTAGPEVLNPCRNLANITENTITLGMYTASDGTVVTTDNFSFQSDFIPVSPNTTYTISANEGMTIIRVVEYDAGGNFIRRNATATSSNASKLTFTTGANTAKVTIGANQSVNNLTAAQVLAANWQLELGSTATEYVPFCANPIKIATTAYNSARFSPVVTELNDTIATIRSVVTNTINQTKAIADLQATKQTRPDETCPAGKKCLLVEDNDGTPHWYEIIENAD